MSTPEQVSRIYKVRKTVFQMLRDRGYSVDDSEINMTRQQFTQHFGERIKRDELFIHKVKEQDSSDQVWYWLSSINKKPLDAAISFFLSGCVFWVVVLRVGCVKHRFPFLFYLLSFRSLVLGSYSSSPIKLRVDLSSVPLPIFELTFTFHWFIFVLLSLLGCKFIMSHCSMHQIKGCCWFTVSYIYPCYPA